MGLPFAVCARGHGGRSQAMTTPPSDSQQILVTGSAGQPAPQDPEAAPEMGPGAAVDRGLPMLIEQPAKVMRIGTMIKQLLDEVRTAPLDEQSRARLREIHRKSIKELEEGLAPELIDELERISLPFADDEVPTEAELRVTQAQLVGWLEGLFHGIQTALFAQQMSARAQFEEMRRRALPPGQEGGAPEEGGDAPGQRPPGSPTGQYL